MLKWFAEQDPRELYLTDVTLMELAYGAEKYALKYRSAKYHTLLKHLVTNQFREHIVHVPQEDFLLAGHLRARREMRGFKVAVQDAQIAATCLSHGATTGHAQHKRLRRA